MGDDVDLVEDDARTEHVECRVIEGSGENDVLEKEEAIGVMYFLLNERVMNGDGLVVASRMAKKVAIVGFVNGKFGVIYRGNGW